ncbi:MAG: hypothetical protein ACD_21C00223G0007 [uncultured bacterium]|nr:MAG: hypothetical protein ACD_21C00223G0007 [uncultured bacterium]
MRNIKLQTVALFCMVLLQTPAFSDQATSSNGPTISLSDAKTGTSDAPATIGWQVAIVNALTGTAKPAADTVLSALNKIFIINRTSDGIAQSTLDAKIDAYVNNFYSWYASNIGFISTIDYTDKDKKTGAFSTAKKYNIKTIQEAVDTELSKLLTKELAYYNQATNSIKQTDQDTLITGLGQKITIRQVDGKDVATPTVAVLGFDSTATIPDNDISTLSINVLLGPDGYEDEIAKQKAQWFMAYLFQLTPPPVEFFTAEQAAATNKDMAISVPDKTDPITVPAEQHTDMIAALNSNSLYKKYKNKYNVLLALQTLYHNNIINMYQTRIKSEDPTSKKKLLSLVEKEKQMATEGLEMTYDDLKKKSVADINLETLYTLNKVVYFLHKLHQDNERAQLVSTIIAMQAQNQDAEKFKTDYIQPIGKFFENKCWVTTKQEDETDTNLASRLANCPQ